MVDLIKQTAKALLNIDLLTCEFVDSTSSLSEDGTTFAKYELFKCTYNEGVKYFMTATTPSSKGVVPVTDEYMEYYFPDYKKS